jgi:hypothetical protein
MFTVSQWLVALCLLLVLAFPSQAQAVLLDEFFSGPTSLASVINECCAFVGQTYTAGVTGVLAGISIDVSLSKSTSPLHVAIRSVTGGLPTTTVLGDVTLSSNTSNLPQLIVFPQVIPQVAGVQYAIVVNYLGAPPEGAGRLQGVWNGATGTGYPGGDLVLSSDGGTSWFIPTPGGDDVHFETFVVAGDTTPPVTTATVSGPSGSNGWYRGNVVVTLSATDPDSPVAATYFTVDAGSKQTYTAPFTISGDAVHHVSFYSVDPAGNQENIKLLTVDIDSTPPVTTANTLGPLAPNGWYKSPVTVNLVATDNRSGVAATSYSLDGGTTWINGNSTSFSADGIYSVGYRSTDVAGNVEATKSVALKIDQKSPVISGMPAAGCTLSPPNQKLVIVATVTASDALSGLAPGSFSVTGTSNEPANDSKSPDIVITPNGTGGYVVQLRADRLGSGNGRIYTLTATANDLAGNTATVTASCAVPHDQGKK